MGAAGGDPLAHVLQLRLVQPQPLRNLQVRLTRLVLQIASILA